jgi:glycosyltransferase involved in cell wall biosynthesis
MIQRESVIADKAYQVLRIDSPTGVGLRIGMDARLFDEITGIGRYVGELGKELACLLPEAEFFLYSPWPIPMPVQSPKWHARIDPWSRYFKLARGFWMTKHAWMLLRVRSLCLRDRINVFWATDAPFIPRLPRIVRIVAMVHDVRYRVAPKTHRTVTFHMRCLLEKRHARAHALIANSQGTRDKLWQYLGYEAVAIVRPAASRQFYRREEFEIDEVLRRYGVRRPYMLSIANADATPHKNTGVLISVFCDLKREGRLKEFTLVLVGRKSEKLLSGCRGAVGNDDLGVFALGFVPDDDLPALYSGADLFLFPSLYEGFGLPVLEARACQTRIVTTDSPELREAGGNRAIYITPDTTGIRSGILTALSAPRTSEPDQLWTWRSGAEILAQVLDPGVSAY